MFLDIVNNTIQIVPSSPYQVDSTTELPLLLERYEIVGGAIQLVLKYTGKSNEYILSDIQSILDEELLQRQNGELESSLLRKLKTIEEQVCKCIIGKEYLSDESYAYIIKNYEAKYVKALAGIQMPLQASQIGISSAELNTLIISLNDSMKASQDALFDVLEAKRLLISDLIFNGTRTDYLNEVVKLETFAKEFMESLGI